MTRSRRRFLCLLGTHLALAPAANRLIYSRNQPPSTALSERGGRVVARGSSTAVRDVAGITRFGRRKENSPPRTRRGKNHSQLEIHINILYEHKIISWIFKGPCGMIGEVGERRGFGRPQLQPAKVTAREVISSPFLMLISPLRALGGEFVRSLGQLRSSDPLFRAPRPPPSKALASGVVPPRARLRALPHRARPSRSASTFQC